MDLLSGYGSDDSSSSPSTSLKPTASTICRMQSAPTPSLVATSKVQSATLSSIVAAPSSNSTLALLGNKKPDVFSTKVSNNMYKSHQNLNLAQPIQGPTAPSAQSGLFKQKNWNEGSLGAAGAYEKVAFDASTFDMNYNSYNSKGKALANDGSEIDASTAKKEGAERHLPIQRPKNMAKAAASDEKGEPPKKKKRRKATTEATAMSVNLDGDDGQFGIWGKPSQQQLDLVEDSLTDAQRGELADHQIARRDEHEAVKAKKEKRAEGAQHEGDTAFDNLVERKLAHLLPPRLADGAEPGPATSKFHGGQEYDYQGRSWMQPPSGVKASDGHDCYLPTKCAHTFKNAHAKGVHKVVFFPRTGHLLLSAGLDGLVKMWRITGDSRKLMRTYDGHTAAVRDVCFNNDGSKFLSASFDRYVRLWDTKTGECLKTFTTRRVPYCVRFWPNDNNFFCVGQSDNKIVTMDATSGEVTQEYNHHLAAVNSILFTEEGRKMVTTSDDKKVLVWEWDIGVPIKHIAEPDMQSMPATTLHPSGDYWVGQSLANEIHCYQATDRFVRNRKKTFKGHQVSGFACNMDFSPNGKYLVSGDGNGKMFVWDWQSGKYLKKFNAHERGPAMSAVWSPIDPSTVATCGWDGSIKLWSN